MRKANTFFIKRLAIGYLTVSDCFDHGSIKDPPVYRLGFNELQYLLAFFGSAVLLVSVGKLLCLAYVGNKK